MSGDENASENAFIFYGNWKWQTSKSLDLEQDVRIVDSYYYSLSYKFLIHIQFHINRELSADFEI